MEEKKEEELEEELKEGKVVIRCDYCGTETDDWLERGKRKLCVKCYTWEDQMYGDIRAD